LGAQGLLQLFLWIKEDYWKPYRDKKAYEKSLFDVLETHLTEKFNTNDESKRNKVEKIKFIEDSVYK
jgi:hypothetical protein